MKAADIDDRTVLAFIAQQRTQPWPNWVRRMDVEALLPDVPPKVVLAKLRQLLKRRLLTGCGCGCRGDFEMTTAGEAFLARADQDICA